MRLPSLEVYSFLSNLCAQRRVPTHDPEIKSHSLLTVPARCPEEPEILVSNLTGFGRERKKEGRKEGKRKGKRKGWRTIKKKKEITVNIPHVHRTQNS